jgi:uncharacterized protein (DUF885 family)
MKIRETIRRLLLLVTLSSLTAVCWSMETKVASVDELFDQYYQFRLRISPTEATKMGEHAYDNKIANYLSSSYRDYLVERYGEFLQAITAFEQSRLSDADKMSLKVMRWDCEIKRQGLTNPIVTVASPIYDLPHIQLMPMMQISSFNLFVAQLASGLSIQPFDTVADYDNWLQRLDDYIAWLETAEGNMTLGIEQGLVFPRVIVERMLAQFDSLLTDDIESHHYYAPIRLIPQTFSHEDQQRLTAAYREMIAGKINPAHRAMRDFLGGPYLKAAGDHTGLGALPNGPHTYQYLVRYHTSTDMTPDEIHALGKREVKRLAGEMESVKKQVGFEGDLRAFFDHVRSSKSQMPFTDPQQVIANFESIRARMEPHVGKLFSQQPKADYEIRRTESFREASASAEYLPGSKDGKRPGTFYVPVPDVGNYNKFADESLFLHEAVPGHHYQLSLQQENTRLPAFLHPEGMGVFVEGWALYSESLGSELGLYEDPYQYFGMLSMEMHRAIRLVVDTGMHAKGWTREQAIQYSLDNEAETEAAITAEIERYMAMPGQALSYKIGQLKIQELRKRAAKALGDNFDIREFHAQVLGSGSLPLVLLEEKIDRWIATTRP